jgi:hypothetical protein
VTAVVLCVSASAAWAETLMMPNRDTLTGINTVVFGVTTQANGTAYSINFGDGTIVNGNVVDQSYIAFDHTYALANTYTATLTIGAESASVQIQAFNPAALSAFDLRAVNINRAIEDALRYLWVNQVNRAANFPAGTTTSWTGIAGYNGPATGLATLAFENHGYQLSNNNNAPTGLYEKYVVRRGLNQIFTLLETQNLDMQPAGNPCAGDAGPDPDGAGAGLCVGFFINQDNNTALGPNNFNHSSYETPFAAMAIAGSGTPVRTVDEVAGATAGLTYGQVLQRIVNAIAWGQLEANINGLGGWYYSLNYGFGQSDGSTVGWVMLGLLDAEAAGAILPAFVRTQWSMATGALAKAINTDGSFDYQSDNNPNSANAVNVAKAGVGLQGMYFAGIPVGDARVQNAQTYLSNRWNEQNPVSLGTTQSFVCQNGRYNKGCGYGMFNVFKGFKLYGVSTLAGVGRAAGPGTIPADDWYADYVDWLVANQTNPTTQTGGQWATAGPATLAFSSQTQNDPAEAALALLILSPVVLVQPDPETFSTLGLQHGNPLVTTPQSNPVNTLHTVVARAVSAGGAAIAGVTISFQVTGRNTATGSGVTDGAGQVIFQYTDMGAANANGSDNIRAFIGQIGSNIQSNLLVKNWVAPVVVTKCDIEPDGDVDYVDLNAIRARNGQLATGPNDPADGNSDGRINVADVRYCQLRLTN